MATMTVLALVQNILSAMESDEVNSVTDTVESTEVLTTLEEVYFQVINDLMPEHFAWQTLIALGDAAHPNYLRLPTGAHKVLDWSVTYDVQISGAADPDFKPIKYVQPAEFIRRTMGRNSSDSDITQFTDFGGGPVLIETDKAPDFWTSFDDDYLVFDSYDSAVDSTLQASKSAAWGQLIPSWTASDTFVPDLDETLFPYFLAEAKATCFVNMKQIENRKVERQARNQKIGTQNDRERYTGRERSTGPNYGRAGRGGRSRVNFGRS